MSFFPLLGMDSVIISSPRHGQCHYLFFSVWTVPFCFLFGMDSAILSSFGHGQCHSSFFLAWTVSFCLLLCVDNTILPSSRHGHCRPFCILPYSRYGQCHFAFFSASTVSFFPLLGMDNVILSSSRHGQCHFAFFQNYLRAIHPAAGPRERRSRVPLLRIRELSKFNALFLKPEIAQNIAGHLHASTPATNCAWPREQPIRGLFAI